MKGWCGTTCISGASLVDDVQFAVAREGGRAFCLQASNPAVGVAEQATDSTSSSEKIDRCMIIVRVSSPQY